MKVFKIVSAALMLALMIGLQGCGCDKDKGQKCVTDHLGKGLNDCGDLTKCLKDASCCDFENNGQKMEDALKQCKSGNAC